MAPLALVVCQILLTTVSADPGNPLILTPYIQKEETGLARNLSEVHGIADLRTSYAGFFTVNELYNSNLYFWFFPAQNGQVDAPLLLWLQGGPGTSSLFGLFTENGPIYVDQDGQVHRRDITWNAKYHLLYIDNPVGTGFSFTNSTLGLSTNETEVATNLYSALTQFFTIFSDYQKNDFYIIGESYAGKYAPAISYKVHMENMQQPKIHINLKGIAIGDGVCDPLSMLPGIGALMYELGLADENQAKFIKSQAQLAAQYIQKGQYLEALEVIAMLIYGRAYPYPTYFTNITGSTDIYNLLRISEPEDFNYYISYVNQTSIRRAIHVGDLSFDSDSNAVALALSNDIMRSVTDWLAVLMDNYKVLIYNGQLDIVVAPPLTERYLQVLQWSGLQQYLAANKKVWKIGDDVAGYVRQVGRFMQVIVRGAGHMVPHDQPERANNLIDMFISMH